MSGPADVTHKRRIIRRITGVDVENEIFGALSQDPDSPLSRISVAHSSFSLDPFRGCPARCAYCTVAGAARDVDIRESDDVTHISLPRVAEQLFSADELVRALVGVPSFIPNQSVISIGTGSTEAFLPRVEAVTWRIIECFVNEGYTNPFWFVCKMGFQNSLIEPWVERFTRMREARVPAVYSVTYSAAPTWVEPLTRDRFLNVDRIKRAGVRVSHHLRPVIAGINDSHESLRRALEASRLVADVICVGGLRRDPGVDLAWQHIYGLDRAMLPMTRGKHLPANVLARIAECMHELDIDVPVVTSSSGALAHLLGIPDYNLPRYALEDRDALLTLPPGHSLPQPSEILDGIARLAHHIGLVGADFFLDGSRICCSRRLSYTENRALIHTIGHSGLLR